MSCANKHDNEGVHLGRDAASIKSQRMGGGGGVRHIRIRSYFPSDSHLLGSFLFHLLELCFFLFFCRCNSLEARSVTRGSLKSPDLSKRHREGEMWS